MFGRTNGRVGLNSSASVNNHGNMKPIPGLASSGTPTPLAIKSSSYVSLTDQRRIGDKSTHTPPILSSATREPGSSPPFDAAVISALDSLLETHFGPGISRDLRDDLGAQPDDAASDYSSAHALSAQLSAQSYTAETKVSGNDFASSSSALPSGQTSVLLADKSRDREVDLMKCTITSLQEQILDLRGRLVRAEKHREESCSAEQLISQDLSTRLQTALSLAEASRTAELRNENGRVFFEQQLRELDKAFQDASSQVLTLQEESVTLKLANSKLKIDLQTSQAKFAALEERFSDLQNKANAADKMQALGPSVREMQAEMETRKALMDVEVVSLRQYAADAAAARTKQEQQSEALSVLLDNTKASLRESQSMASSLESAVAELKKDLRIERSERKSADERCVELMASYDKQLRSIENEREYATEAVRAAQSLLASEKLEVEASTRREQEMIAAHSDSLLAEHRKFDRFREDYYILEVALREAREAIAKCRVSEEVSAEERVQALTGRLDSLLLELESERSDRWSEAEKALMALQQSEAVQNKLQSEVREQTRRAQEAADMLATLQEKEIKQQAETEAYKTRVELLGVSITEKDLQILHYQKETVNAAERAKIDASLGLEELRKQLEAQYSCIAAGAAQTHARATDSSTARALAAEERAQALTERLDSLLLELESERSVRKSNSEKALLALQESETVQNALRGEVQKQTRRAQEAADMLATLQEAKRASDASAEYALNRTRLALDESLAASTRAKVEQMSAHASTLTTATEAYEEALQQQETRLIAAKQTAEEALVAKHVRIVENLSVMHAQELNRRDTAQRAAEAAFEAVLRDAQNAAAASEFDAEEVRASLRTARSDYDASIKLLQQEHAQRIEESEANSASRLSEEVSAIKVRYEQEVKALREELRVASESVKSKASKIQWHIDDHEIEIARFAEEAEVAAKAATAKAASDLATCRLQYEREIEEMRRQLEQAQASINNAATGHESRLLSLAREHNQSQALKQEQHEAELARLHARLASTEERFNTIRKRLETEAMAEKQRIDKMLAAVHADHAAELETRIDTQTKAVQARESALAKAREGAALDRQTLENEILRLQGELSDSEERRRADAHDARRSAEDVRKHARSEIAAHADSQRAEATRVAAAHDVAVQEMAKQQAAVLHELREECASTIEKQSAQAARAAAEAEASRIRLGEELMRRIKALQSEREELVRSHKIEVSDVNILSDRRLSDQAESHIAALSANAQKYAAVLSEKQETFAAEIRLLKDELQAAQEAASLSHSRAVESDMARRAAQEECRILRASYAQQVEECKQLQDQLSNVSGKFEEECAELQRRHKAGASHLASEYAALQKRHSAAVESADVYRQQAEVNIDKLSALRDEMEIMNRAADNHSTALNDMRATMEHQKSAHRAELESERERTVKVQHALDELVIAQGERLAIAEDESNGRRSVEIETLRRRLVAQDEAHAKAIEEHLQAEERLWKDREALARAAVASDIALAAARKQAMAAQIELKESSTIHALRGEELAKLRQDNANLASDRQRDLAESARELSHLRASCEAQLEEARAVSERATHSHVQHMAASERRLADVQLSAAREIAAEKELASSARVHAEKGAKKLLESQEREAKLKARLENIDPQGTTMQRMQRALEGAQLALRKEQKERLSDKELQWQSHETMQKDILRLSSELDRLGSASDAVRLESDAELVHLKEALRDAQQEKLRLSAALYDSENAAKHLQLAVDEQRAARSEQEVRNSKLERQLDRTRAQKHVIEAAAVYKNSLALELSQLNPNSDRTIVFIGANQQVSPPGSPDETCNALASGTPQSRLKVMGDKTPTTAVSCDSTDSGSGSSGGSKRAGMTNSRIVIHSASKLKFMERSGSAPRGRRISFPEGSDASTPRRTFFDTESEGDY